MSPSHDHRQPAASRPHRTVLQKVDHAAVFGALDQPPPPTPKLKSAAARFRKTVVSR